MRKGTTALFSIGLILLITGCQSPATSFRGQLAEEYFVSNETLANEEMCGTDVNEGFDEYLAGTQLTLLDEQGSIVGLTTLVDGKLIQDIQNFEDYPTGCKYSFVFENVESDSNFFTIQGPPAFGKTGGRFQGEITLERSQLESGDFTILLDTYSLFYLEGSAPN